MKKNFLLSFMLICISIFVFGILTVSAYNETKYGDYLYYRVEDNGEVTITDCDERATEIIIPAKYMGNRLKALAILRLGIVVA